MINLISAFLSLFNVNYFLGFIKNGVFPLKLDENEENEYVKKLFIKEEHDEAILWHRLPGETDCCQGRRYAFSWYTHTDICSCTNGSLAGSYGDLRQQG